ncbi:hypothetical protein PILCRDRAFT_4863 [Piloderma croceum F 1598]|uniref:Uncharacterized protein n=1 Tax=Piloderma croceum (strain F 1598) TaxID=765440 RepID=A0A0C3G3C0_PILCF|nr:hypothetical protein PILCRDRAFT_4863 [Piloderma croceum F 1598]
MAHSTKFHWALHLLQAYFTGLATADEPHGSLFAHHTTYSNLYRSFPLICDDF